MVKFTHLVSKEAEKISAMQNICSGKFFKNSMRPLRSPFPVMLQSYFNRRVVKGHLGTQRSLEGELEHSKSTRGAVKENLSTRRALQGHLETQGTRALEHLSTRVLEGYLGTWGTLFSRLFRNMLHEIFIKAIKYKIWKNTSQFWSRKKI